MQNDKQTEPAEHSHKSTMQNGKQIVNLNDDPRLGSLIKKGKTGQIVILGVPFDYSRKRTIRKGGEENGPCCLRRFFPKVGPLHNSEYGIDISQLEVTDAGNVQLENQGDITAPERAISRISQEVFGLLSNNQLPFVFGGAKEGTYGASLAFEKAHPSHRHLLITGKPTLRRPFDEDKLSSDNLMTMLTRNRAHKLTLFGSSVRYFPQDFDRNFDLLSYEEIRKTKWSQSELINTQGGFAFEQLLTGCGQSPVHVTLSVEAIERFRGCRDVMAMGLSVEEMVQIFLLLGTRRGVLLVDICEFNPSVQDYESSLLLVNLLYYFLLGWTKRPQ